MSDTSINLRHSVVLNADACSGCTRCLRSCPTEAIRIRDGLAQMNDSICIDCGECIKQCPHNAFTATFDPLDAVFRFPYTIALPAPSFYGQFENRYAVNDVLKALLEYGFDDVYEVSCAAEMVSGYTRQYMRRPDVPKPLISSACPAVVRLIQHQFPDLIDNISPILPPVELAAREARREALAKHPNLKTGDIGICYISACPAEVSYLDEGREKGNSEVNSIVSVNEIYFAMAGKLKVASDKKIATKAGALGINWAISGGESEALFHENHLAADGMDNVTHILEMISNGSFPELEFVELNACHGGCIGGVMSVENGFVAKARLRNICRSLPEKTIALSETSPIPEECLKQEPPEVLRNANWPTNMAEAFRNRARMQQIVDTLPGIDCGACGSPNCLAYAKDIVMGRVGEDECVVQQRMKWKTQN